MTATVHVYDLSNRLVAVGLDTEIYTRAAAEVTMCPSFTVQSYPCHLVAEIALYSELAAHDGQIRFPHPRMN